MAIQRAICTVITRNHIPRAKALHESLHKSGNAGYDFRVLIVDKGALSKAEQSLCSFAVCGPDEFLDAESFASLSFRYSLFELATSFKPLLIKFLIEDGYDQVLYLDSDVYVYKPLDCVFESLNEANILLTPHFTKPFGTYGKFSELELLQDGSYNSGLVGVSSSAESKQFLNWWSARLKHFCRDARSEGLFVDQKWLDLVPAMFDGVKIVRNSGLNVAPWNMHTRTLVERDEEYFVDGSPLIFYHFSFFNPDAPDAQCNWSFLANISDSSKQAMRRLMHEYAASLKLNGHDLFKEYKSPFACFSNGVTVDDTCRAIFREFEEHGKRFPFPHNVLSTPSFFDWLNQSADADFNFFGRTLVTNYLLGYMKQDKLLARLLSRSGSSSQASALPCLFIVARRAAKNCTTSSFTQHLPRQPIILAMQVLGAQSWKCIKQLQKRKIGELFERTN